MRKQICFFVALLLGVFFMAGCSKNESQKVYRLSFDEENQQMNLSYGSEKGPPVSFPLKPNEKYSIVKSDNQKVVLVEYNESINEVKLYIIGDAGLCELENTIKVSDYMGAVAIEDDFFYYIADNNTEVDGESLLIRYNLNTGEETEIVSTYMKGYLSGKPSIRNGNILHEKIDGRIFLLTKNGENRFVVDGNTPVWYDDNSFIFQSNEILYYYNLADENVQEFLDSNGKEIKIHNKNINSFGFSLSEDRTHIAYYCEQRNYVFFFFRVDSYSSELIVANLQDGSEYSVHNKADEYFMPSQYALEVM